jgi:single-strand DNA-binding protein
MSQDNQITLRGYLTAEPRLYQKTATAIPVTEIRVGSTPRRLNRETGEWQDAPTSYFTVKCWRRLAINAASSLHKGETVIIRGRFYANTWVDSQQQTRTRLEIEADSLGHDLAYGWSHFLRGVRQQQRDTAADGGELARQDVELSEAAEAAEATEASEVYEAVAVADSDGDLDGDAPGVTSSAIDLHESFAGLPEAEAVPF